MSLDKKLRSLYSGILDGWLVDNTQIEVQLLRDINAYVMAMKANAHKSKLLAMQKRLVNKYPTSILEHHNNNLDFPE